MDREIPGAIVRPVLIEVGTALDSHAGSKREAPGGSSAPALSGYSGLEMSRGGPAHRGGLAPASSADGRSPRVDVLGVGVSAVTMADALSTIDQWISAGDRRYICVTGVHGVIESQDDPELRNIHNAAGLVVPDGMPLVWLSRLSGHRHVERVCGPDLMLACCAASVSRGYRHYFYGGAPGVPELLTARLQARFPGLIVAGRWSPPFGPQTPAEEEAAITRINAARPDIVWVGLSTPKQEKWMARHVSRLCSPVLIGVGAAFDFHAGLKSRAPRWMQRSGLEWLFRLGTEPRRLWRRYLINNPRFVHLLLLRAVGIHLRRVLAEGRQNGSAR
jgi:N-acetylglucosaminyldiphosphoundecaprenol N-acetyl-beta-D-mannosaminyltransferase